MILNRRSEVGSKAKRGGEEKDMRRENGQSWKEGRVECEEEVSIVEKDNDVGALLCLNRHHEHDRHYFDLFLLPAQTSRQTPCLSRMHASTHPFFSHKA